MATTVPAEQIRVQCCIVGGGPAGMMLGFLLARAGVKVLVLEKHADFLRDFRGDTIHPSTLEILHELGLLKTFLKRPHQEAVRLTGFVSGNQIVIADFSHLPTQCHFIAFMPQWDFLDFIAQQARLYSTFQLRMQAKVTGLIKEHGSVIGARATTPEGLLEVRADLVVGTDGRHSIVRGQAGLKVVDLKAPIDVLWMRLSRKPTDPEQPLGHFDRGRIFVMLDRSDYWQCGYVIPKGGYEVLRQRGLPQLCADIAEIVPFLADRVGELTNWSQIHLLTVAVDRLRKWYRPGVLCIGDAAHAMSPVGGVGINLAIQDAVAAANLLAPCFRGIGISTDDLCKVQRRRELPTRLTQTLQVLIQDRVITRVLGSRRRFSLPWPLKLVRRFPILRRIPARVLGLGFRAEHVRPDSNV
jgi:2-polyprenyl-6-methoxyphenol hydroxylase-like FAD-dependent oxidoreductase